MKLNILVITMILIALIWCLRPNIQDDSSNYVLPAHLRDCSITILHGKQLSSITVIRCPNSSTTTKVQGKHPKTTVVIDGDTYVKE